MNLDQSFMLLQPGERAGTEAPQVTLPNGASCIPQQFLEYQHSIHTVEAILNDLSFSTRYPIFVAEDQGQLYLQVGVIGPDNYSEEDDYKIVYGRKWRIESELPTSEVIQTAFLAVQKAREHEVRERFVLTHCQRQTTPFNNHHDLPLMAQNADMFKPPIMSDAMPDIERWLTRVSYDGSLFTLKNKVAVNNTTWFLDLELAPAEKNVLEEVQQGLRVSLVLESLSFNHLLHALLEQLVLESNRWVAEQFQYRNFARFSRNVKVTAIAEVSSKTRDIPLDSHSFNAHQQLQYEVDQQRRPLMEPSDYSFRLAHQLAEFEPLQGFKPEIKKHRVVAEEDLVAQAS